MTTQETSNNWVWKRVLKVNNNTVRCNINNCFQIFHKSSTSRSLKRIKGHIYHKHRIWTEEDRLEWENDNHMLWRYFDKVDLYTSKCKFCKRISKQAYILNLKEHLLNFHIQEIKAAIYEKNTNKSLSQYFEINEENFTAWCKCCNNYGEDIFYGTDALIHHIQSDECIEYRNRFKDNSVNKMTQQSIADENASTSSHHDNLNRQAPGNRENEQW